jgi:hypothetical protein
VAVAVTLACYDTATITAVKSFIVQPLDRQVKDVLKLEKGVFKIGWIPPPPLYFKLPLKFEQNENTQPMFALHLN